MGFKLPAPGIQLRGKLWETFRKDHLTIDLPFNQKIRYLARKRWRCIRSPSRHSILANVNANPGSALHYPKAATLLPKCFYSRRL